MERFVQIFSGTLLPVALMGAGAFFLLYVSPLLLCCPRRGKRGGETRKAARRGSFSALAVALAGTLGVGNVAGVASAIALGGPGAVFWMWVSALLAMSLKYAEVVLALRTRVYDAAGRPHGGAPYYIREAFGGRLGAGAAALFAALCALCSLTLGGVVQSAAAAEAVWGAFGVPPPVTGLLIGLCAALLLSLGAKGVERACGVLVTAVCLLFTVAAVAALILRAAALPAAFAAIFRGAFSWKSGGAGALGFFTARAVRYGVARGLVSNEAGCGTAPIAHAAAEVDLPARQGLFGIAEVFVDTVLLCTLTALVLLVSGVPAPAGGGMRYALNAFSAVLGPAAAPLLACSVLLFAFATVLCWSHYGAESALAFTGREKPPRFLPAAVFVACAFGAVAAPALVWDMTDLLLALMALLNIAALLAQRRAVLAETARLFR